VVGLAVDYVVHLAEGYHMSPHPDRLSRVRDMLEFVGISVISGATSTIGASLFMVGAKIRFFMQFGLFMFSTIGFSLLYSLVLFTTVLGLIGPQGNVGSITPIWRWIVYKVRGRQKTDVDCGKCTGKGFHGVQ
jgi:predicted RND superfamily exporter protein